VSRLVCPTVVRPFLAMGDAGLERRRRTPPEPAGL